MTDEDVMIDDSSGPCDLAPLLVADILINHLSVIEINSTHSPDTASDVELQGSLSITTIFLSNR